MQAACAALTSRKEGVVSMLSAFDDVHSKIMAAQKTLQQKQAETEFDCHVPNCTRKYAKLHFPCAGVA